jgi:regulator of cell morphogenesis and NO signaling
MSAVQPSTPIGELVANQPGRAQVFERFGLDYCCGGRQPLEAACAEKRVRLEDVLKSLHEADLQPSSSERDWSEGPAAELIDHIISTHHAYLRTELPRLADLFVKVARVHGARHPEVGDCNEVFNGLRAELESHMFKEEQILFPMIREMEEARSTGGVHCGTVQNPIRVMEMEHDHAGDALARLRAQTNGYAPPADACASFHALLDGLSRLEADLHRHIHKENNILFPKAVRLEAELCAAG